MISILNNTASDNAQVALEQTNLNLNNTLQQLSTGLRINNSGDDAAGLAVANSYRNKVAVLNQGIANANDGLSVLQTQDGALSNISQLIDRLSALATESASSSSSVNRTTLNNEFSSVLSEINREATVAGLAATQNFSVFVSNDSSNGTIGGTIGRADTSSSGLNIASLTVDTAAHAATAVASLATAVTTLGTTQATVGQLENRLQYAITLGQNQVVNTSASQGQIEDANIAEESSKLTQDNILNQSGIAALAQANSAPQALLQLLR